MVNRLTAVTAQLELLGEEEPPSTIGGSPSLLESLRAEMAASTRGAKVLSDAIALHLPSPSVTNLFAVLRDAIAPRERYLRRRETRIVLAPIPRAIEIAIEPDVVLAAVGAVLDVLLQSALPSETVHIAYERCASSDVLRASLLTRATPPDGGLIESELASLRTWLEARGGSLEVVRAETELSVSLAIPSALVQSDPSA
ncbi:MAG TPA: hypothetical protein VNO21_01030 [Polyangiaceae bacterium]|nr:hypothetical protein [Polyangiaceae bacterium]